MQFLTIILAAFLVACGVASPLQVADVPTAAAGATATAAAAETWTLDNIIRTRDKNNTICHWTMTISKSAAPSNTTNASSNCTTASEEPAQCDFTVHTPAGQDCGMMQWDARKCSATNGEFAIGGGHNSYGFVVLVVTDTSGEANKHAWFGATDVLLDSGDNIPPQTSPVFDHY
ncbi:hypothetical protein F4777DRAFT_582396 [Nemania sp. FL0916]|nr:hypothetical protein F4777DRAFT_582396 [Nemania sp. FL0916]